MWPYWHLNPLFLKEGGVAVSPECFKFSIKPFVCVALMFFLFLFVSLRYNDLAIPTLGDKKKLSPEEKCRSVLQHSKFQGWQVCVRVCFHTYCVFVHNKDLPNDLIPDPLVEMFLGIYDNSFQLSHLIIILVTHTNTNTRSSSAAPAPPRPFLSATLLLCLSLWPYRSRRLPPSTCIHTPPQCPADTFSCSSALHKTRTHTTSNMCWND